MDKSNKSDTLKKNLLKALALSHSVVTDACKKAGCSRKTFYEYLKEDKAFASEVEDIKEQALDFTESQLFKLINGYSLPEDKVFFRAGDQEPTIVKGKKHLGPDTTAVIFHLKTKGKKRGYVERTEHTGKDGEPLGLINWTDAASGQSL
jgi:hypothetical protein